MKKTIVIAIVALCVGVCLGVSLIHFEKSEQRKEKAAAARKAIFAVLKQHQCNAERCGTQRRIDWGLLEREDSQINITSCPPRFREAWRDYLLKIQRALHTKGHADGAVLGGLLLVASGAGVVGLAHEASAARQGIEKTTTAWDDVLQAWNAVLSSANL